MNRKFKDEFGDCKPPLPLSMSGNIVCGNATRLDWEKVCPKFSTKELDLHEACEKVRWESMPLGLTYPEKKEEYEIYILGNPPYLGSTNQSKSQKEDLDLVFATHKNYKNLDYISCWLYKASQYIKDTEVRCAFVSTSSICQGEQVDMLWSLIYKLSIEIDFAYTPFKWSNNAKNAAGVVVTIIGLRNVSKKNKYIYDNASSTLASNINAYLIDIK